MPQTTSVQGTSLGRVEARKLYTRRPAQATPGSQPIMVKGQKSGSQAPSERIASKPAVIRPQRETTCIDSMHAFRVNLG